MKVLEMAFGKSLMIHGLGLMVILAIFVVLGAENALGYTGAGIYTLLTVVTMVRKWKELTRCQNGNHT